MWMPKRNEILFLERNLLWALRLALGIVVAGCVVGLAASEAWAQDKAAGANRSNRAPVSADGRKPGLGNDGARAVNRDLPNLTVLRRRLRYALTRQVGKPIAAAKLRGFVADIYAKVGIDLPRDVAGLKAAGRQVAPTGLQLGDALFFGPGSQVPTAVALFDGRGHIVFPARTSFDADRFTVHRQPVDGWFEENFIEVRRYLPEAQLVCHDDPESEVADESDAQPEETAAGLPGGGKPGDQPGAGENPGGGGNPLEDLFSRLMGKGDPAGGGQGVGPDAGQGGGGAGAPSPNPRPGQPASPNAQAPNACPNPRRRDPVGAEEVAEDDKKPADDDDDDDQSGDDKEPTSPFGNAVKAAGDAVADAVLGAAGLLADIFDLANEPGKGKEGAGGANPATGDPAASGQPADGKADGRPASEADELEAEKRARAEAASRREAITEAWNKARIAAYVETQEQIRMANNRERSAIRNAEQNRKDAGWFGDLSRGVTGADPYQREIDLAHQKLATLKMAGRLVEESRSEPGTGGQIAQLNKARRLVGIREVDPVTGRISDQPPTSFGVNRVDIRR